MVLWKRKKISSVLTNSSVFLDDHERKDVTYPPPPPTVIGTPTPTIADGLQTTNWQITEDTSHMLRVIYLPRDATVHVFQPLRA